jgi:hypothetical protein
MRRALACLSLLLIASTASAQDREGFRIDRFRPPPSSEDGLGIQYARTLGHLVPSAGLILDYAHAPLVARTTLGEYGEVVSHRFLAHVSAALGILDFLELHLRVPVAFTGSDAPTVGGHTFSAPDVVGIGDGTLGGSVSLYSEGRRGFTLGLMVEGFLPWGSSTSLASDTEFGARGQLLAGYALDPVTISLVVGGAYRPDRDLAAAHVGSELEYALGFLVPALADLDFLLELVGAIGLREGQVFAARTTPLELMLGARGRVGGGWALEAGIGMGITQTPGVPDVRATAGLRWTLPPAPPVDSDGDGYLDPDDQCVDQPEDRDGWEDADGCIDPDDDGDGWMDEDDTCPRAAEDRDGFLDRDGCPDEDDDGDGVADAEDRCPRAPGATFQRGCPQLMRLDADRIALLWPIDFAPESAEVPVNAGGVLDEIARTLGADPSGMRWRIAVRPVPAGRHDDGVATAQARAQALVTALVSRGVSADRLDAALLPVGPGEPIEITSLGTTTVQLAAPPPSTTPAEVAPPVQP